MTDLISYEEARDGLMLGRTDTTLQPQLERIITSATELIEEHFGIGVQRQITETSHGLEPYVLLKRWPVVSIDTVEVDGVAISAGELADYFISDNDQMGRVWGHRRLPQNPYGLSVTYTAGRFTTQQNVSAHWREGVLLQIRHMWKPYQESTGEVNEFDTAAIAANSAGLARGVMDHFHGSYVPGLA